MGRRILGGILGGLALLTQLLLPAAASRNYAQTADPSGHILLCAPGAGTNADHGAPGGLPSHHEHCPLCQIAVAASPLLDGRSVSVAAPYTEARPIFWALVSSNWDLSGFDRHRPPRGPPPLV